MIWHYTHDGKIEAIKRSGMLKAFNDYDHAHTWRIYISPAALRKMAKEKRAVWFSANDVYEPSAAKTNGVNLADHFGFMLHLGEVYRFGIDDNAPGVMPYRKAFKAIGLSANKVARMEEVTRCTEHSKSSDHFAVLHDVPLSEVKAIQRYDKSLCEWVDVTL